MSRFPTGFLASLFTRQERAALGFLLGMGVLGFGVQAYQRMRPAGAAFLSAPEPVAVNRAGVPELISLPGIGPVLARRIVEHREEHGRFLTLGDLSRVRGISKRTLSRLKGYVRFD